MRSLVRYDPYGEWQRMRWEMDRLFDEVVGFPRTESLVERLAPRPDWLISWNRTLNDNLAVDMVETDDAITIRTALPGVRPEDVSIEERDGWLTIRAQSRREEEREQTGWYVRERRYGAWQRTLRLPADVNADKADAELHNGVLTVTLPKGKTGTPLLQRINVKVPKLSLPKISLPKLGKGEKGEKVPVRS